ncbi:MAG: amino acid ABC transporter permease, partial [Verrucomicrobiota bacterium]
TAGQLSRFWPTKILSTIYVELLRGLPLLALILIGYYVVAFAIGWNHRYSFGIVIIAVFSGAYLSEIFRAGIQSIPESQRLSARAIGFSERQTYLYVIIPQTIRRVLPASTGQFANLIKDSSLLYVISIPELAMQSRETMSKTYANFEALMPLIIGYLVLTLPISLYSRHLEKKFGYSE